MTTLEIQKMNVRIPGYSPQQSHEIGQRVAQALAARVESLTAGRQLGRLQLKIRAPEGQTPEQLMDIIIQAIMDQIEG